MRVEFRSVELNHDSDVEGRLVFVDGRFAALLSLLSKQHAEYAGRWFLEFGLGALGSQEANFADLAEAESWIKERVAH